MPTVDLSRTLADGTWSYPGDPPVTVTPHATVEADGYRVRRVELGSHAGTHVDAPSHTEPDGRSLASFSLATFRFDARLVDLRGLDPRAAVPPEALPESDADLLVLRTGWAERWGEPSYRDHPYLARETAARCAERGHHVAVDAPSVDPTPSDRTEEDDPAGVPAHHELLGADRLVIENLCNLGAVPDRFELHAYPLKLDGDGAPVRAVAVLE